MKRLDNKGQVWVETVIYTLIGIAIIGLVLAVAMPKINAKKDETVIEQSIESLKDINDVIYTVQRAAGNRRAVEILIGKGRFIIDNDNDEISWIIESSFEYSEAGSTISIGNIDVSTRESTPYEVELTMSYAMDIRYGDQETNTKELSSAPVPYRLLIENQGTNSEGNIIISIRES